MVDFAEQVGIVKDRCDFMAVDGEHTAVISNGIVELKMGDVGTIDESGDAFILDTGSPHYVAFTQDILSLDVKKEGAAIRYSDRFKTEGINVNFLEAPRIASLYDEPFADSSAIPTYLVSHLARSKVTVSLSGDGGDELFSGYPRYMFAARMWSALGKIPLRQSLSELLLKTPVGVLDKMFLPFAMLLKRFGSNGDSPGTKVKRAAEFLHADSFDSFYDGIVSTFQDPCSFVLGTTRFERMASEPIPTFSNVDYMAFTDTLNYMPIVEHLDAPEISVEYFLATEFFFERIS